MPFKSRKQWKWAYATGQPFARRWAHKTSYKSLPTKKRKAKKGRSKK